MIPGASLRYPSSATQIDAAVAHLPLVDYGDVFGATKAKIELATRRSGGLTTGDNRPIGYQRQELAKGHEGQDALVEHTLVIRVPEVRIKATSQLRI